MTSEGDYIQVLPDYTYDDDDTSKTASKRPYNTADDHDDASSQVRSRDTSTVTSLYEHPQPSESADSSKQRSAYQRVITSQRLDAGEHMRVMTSDETYDEIADIPAPPPLRQGRHTHWSLTYLLIRCIKIRHAQFPSSHTRSSISNSTVKIRRVIFWTMMIVIFFFLFIFFFCIYFFLATCARLSWSHSSFESTLNSSIV